MSTAHPPREVGDPLLFTYEEARRKLGVSLSQLYRLMRDGKVRSLELGPQVRRIPLSELEAYVKQLIAEQWDADPEKAA